MRCCRDLIDGKFGSEIAFFSMTYRAYMVFVRGAGFRYVWSINRYTAYIPACT